ncbi:sensor histidine kinase [Micromonospora sp. NPDC048830]|uniref:sensor histidine kinase n=1 Tax=Micromonospora sp. NPDC048830 TaxID=3364257 RepID=UPI00371B7AB5
MSTSPAISSTARPTGRHIGTAIAVAVALLNYSILSVSQILRHHPTATEFTASIVLHAILLLLQIRHSLSAGPGHRPVHLRTLAVQAAITYGPFLLFPESWSGMPGLLAGSVLLLLPTVPAWLLFAVTVAFTDGILATLGHPAADLVETTALTSLTGLAVFGLSHLARLVCVMGQLPERTARVARAATERERFRIRRDLHDTLGYSLSLIVLKSELAYRLVPARDDRAREEIREVVRTSRRALTEVRAVASGSLTMSLPAETRSAAGMLSQVGIDTTVKAEVDQLPASVDVVLATVLREGVTNLLRHSQARHCRIEIVRAGASVRLTIFNDGAGPDARSTPAAEGGAGIGNLRSRLAEIGGGLTVTRLAPDGFLLRAVAPLPARVDQGASRTSCR